MSRRSIKDRIDRLESMRTQGVEGVKADRMNMAFTPTNYDYIRVMAAIRGISNTRFVNDVIKAHMDKYGDKYEMAKAILRTTRGDA